MGYSLPPGAPRRRCACRVITETPLALTPLSRARGATVSSGGSTTSSNPGVDAAQSDSPATGGTGGGASAADGAAGQSGGDAPAAAGTQTDAAIADGQSNLQADVGPFGDLGKYWIRIEASQIGIPDWGMAQGTGGDSTHFMFDIGAARFSTVAGDVAFTLR